MPQSSCGNTCLIFLVIEDLFGDIISWSWYCVWRFLRQVIYHWRVKNGCELTLLTGALHGTSVIGVWPQCFKCALRTAENRCKPAVLCTRSSDAAVLATPFSSTQKWVITVPRASSSPLAFLVWCCVCVFLCPSAIKWFTFRRSWFAHDDDCSPLFDRLRAPKKRREIETNLSSSNQIWHLGERRKKTPPKKR